MYLHTKNELSRLSKVGALQTDRQTDRRDRTYYHNHILNIGHSPELRQAAVDDNVSAKEVISSIKNGYKNDVYKTQLSMSALQRHSRLCHVAMHAYGPRVKPRLLSAK